MVQKKRNIAYENKFRAYLFSGDIDRYRQICKNINVKSSQERKRGKGKK